MQELVEDATGHKCPCKQGGDCPIVPVDLVLTPRRRESSKPAERPCGKQR